MTTVDVLKRAFLFESLSKTQIEEIVQLGQEKNFRAGEEIIKQGNRAETVHILLNGRISVRVKDNEETDLMAKTLQLPGAVFGTVALVEPYVYNVTAEAVSEATTFAIEAFRLAETMRANSVVGFEIMSSLCRSYLHRLNVKRTGMISLYKLFRAQSHKAEIYDTYRDVA